MSYANWADIWGDVWSDDVWEEEELFPEPVAVISRETIVQAVISSERVTQTVKCRESID